MENIVIATIKEWNIQNFYKLKKMFEKDFNLHLVVNKEELNIENISKINPKYIFFPHWSWIIPNEIYTNYECIVFHMTDLPFGRGGSPLQNLIINQIYDTKISALKVEKQLDAGDIYLKEDFNISKGSAEDIFQKASEVIFFKMIPTIINTKIVPQKQNGKVVLFNRRTKEESNLSKPNFNSKRQLYDFIRMLDAQGYPKAYMNFNEMKIEFSKIEYKNGKLIGSFEVDYEEK